MGGPWEKYQQPAEAAGPWSKYAAAAPAPAAEEPGAIEQAVRTVGRYAKMLTPAGVASNLFTAEGRQDLLDSAAGGIRGAGSIGATLLAPYDMAVDAIKGDRRPTLSGLVTGQQPISRNHERRQDMTQGLQFLGANPDSGMFQASKLATEVGGTAGVGSGLAATARAVPVLSTKAAPLLTSIETSGMSAGGINGLRGLALRSAGGGITGGASAGLIDPEQAAGGGALGAVLPPALKGAAAAGNALGTGLASGAKRLMQSAIKPTIAQLKSGEADIAVQTLLDNGINPTRSGVAKLRDLIDAKNAEIAGMIGSSNATVDKKAVLGALADTRQQFGRQVSPTADLASIQNVADDFLAHPNFPGQTIPVQAAQDLKQGTYRVLSKKYGQMGSAETEAQKALARGLKDEIATAVPGVGALNAEESRLLTTLSVAERRALMEMNKNPMGLATLASNPVSWAAFMADKSALFKSLAARAINRASSVPGAAQGALGNSTLGQLVYRSAPALTADQ